MGGGGDSGGSGDQRTYIRYAPYIEERHEDFLNEVYSWRELLKEDSPFDEHVATDLDPAFFGTGYVLSSFPSLYDMYGKFMAGLDIEALFDQSLEDTLNGNAANNIISTHATTLSDDLEQVVLPRYVTGMRDVNSVLSSTFVVGKAMLEDRREKELTKYAAEIKYRLVPTAVSRWEKHLDWNRTVVMTYAELLKLYVAASIDMGTYDYNIASKNKLWPFTVLDFERAALGALQGARNSETMAGEDDSGLGGIIGGTLAGAAAGWTVGGPIGAVVGGALGLAGGLLG